VTIKTPEQVAHETLGEGQGWHPGTKSAVIDILEAGINADRAQTIEMLNAKRDEYQQIAHILAGMGGVELEARSIVALLGAMIKRLEA
jgi:hypothetical protein